MKAWTIVAVLALGAALPTMARAGGNSGVPDETSRIGPIRTRADEHMERGGRKAIARDEVSGRRERSGNRQ
jgi:hypothetical protein